MSDGDTSAKISPATQLLVVLLPNIFAVPVQGVFYAQMFTDLIVLLMGIVLLIRAFGIIRREEG